jgi:hypothetical protein
MRLAPSRRKGGSNQNDLEEASDRPWWWAVTAADALGGGAETGRKRNGGRRCRRPPLSRTWHPVPVRAWALPPRRVPAEALRPRSVPVVPLRRISLFLSGFPRVPSRNGPKAALSGPRGGPHRFDPLQLPVRNTDRSRSSCRHSFRDNLPPGGRRLSRDDQEKVGSARKPRASSPARPRFRFAPLFLAEEPRSASAAAGRFLSVAGKSRVRPRPEAVTTRRFGQAKSACG